MSSPRNKKKQKFSKADQLNTDYQHAPIQSPSTIFPT